MKSLNEYLIESKQEYNYRIKIAGDLSDETVTQMEKAFAAFDLINLTGPKTTPVTKHPLGFNGLENETVNILDATFSYPATTEQFVEIAKQCGVAANRIIVLNKAFDDSMNDEEANKEKSDEDGLLARDLPQDTAEHKKANKDYGDSYQENAIQNRAKSEYEVAGGKTPKAKTTNDLPQGTKSPLTQDNREAV